MKNTPKKVIENTDVGMVMKGYGGLFIVTSVNKRTFEITAEPMSMEKYAPKALMDTFEQFDFKDSEWYK